MKTRTLLPSWQALNEQVNQMKEVHMNDLFSADKKRFEKLSIELPSLLLDYSKNLITDETKSALINLAKECEVESWRERMFTGERINNTEDRDEFAYITSRDLKAPLNAIKRLVSWIEEDAAEVLQAESLEHFG
ncbi:MAG: hypothetical protein ACJA2G_000853, partial [Cognaticolwellia sp.]